jgi:hypothetical protein
VPATVVLVMSQPPGTRLRIVLLCRDGADQRYLAAELAGAGLLDAVVVENRGDARRTELLKTFRTAHIWTIPLKALDVVALVLYGNWSEKLLADRLAVADYPAGLSRIDISGANDPASVEALAKLRPDILVVLGTGILRDPVLAIPTSYALNVHGGKLPEYRNVYSDFWPLANDDQERVGSTIFHLAPGVDTGDNRACRQCADAALAALRGHQGRELAPQGATHDRRGRTGERRDAPATAAGCRRRTDVVRADRRAARARPVAHQAQPPPGYPSGRRLTQFDLDLLGAAL